MSNTDFESLVDMLCARSEYTPDARALEFVEDGAPAIRCSYEELHHRASQIAIVLSARARPGDRALLLYPPGLDYVAAFFGCLYAGVIAVPAYPPSPMRLARTLPRLTAIIKDCGADTVLTTKAIAGMAPAVSALAPGLGTLHWEATDAIDVDPTLWRRGSVAPSTLAFIQYTSGSTGAPKGVVLEHRHLLNNSAMIQSAFNLNADSRGVIWLPPYHDMGLIGGILQPIYAGFEVTLMSPLSFLKRPLFWLETIARTRATCSGGPNFAYDLCIRKTTDAQRASVDLSSWNVAFTGAEPVRSDTLAGFADAFARSGFDRRAFYPCYGLAEGTLIVSGGESDALPVEKRFDADKLTRGVAKHDPDGPRLVGCGHSRASTEVTIVDANNRPVGDGMVGEIWVRGPSVARAYWGAEAKTTETFGARLQGGGGAWLRTGDLGFLDADQLFVTGRAKDLIIVRGRNLYPQDLELAVDRSNSAFRSGNIVAFGVDVDAEEAVVIVAEVEKGVRAEKNESLRRSAIEAATAALGEQFGVAPHDILLVPGNTLPKTSSGKLQRSATKDAFLAGAFEVIGSARRDSASSLPEDIGDELDELDELEVAMWLKERVAELIHTEPKRINARQSLPGLGVDSLRSVELVEAIQSHFKIQVSLEQALRAPDLLALAAEIVTAPAASISVGLYDPKSPYKLSAGQQALWFLHRLDPTSSTYNVSKAVEISSFDRDRFEAALLHVTSRHGQLRAVFEEREGIPVQRELDTIALPLTLVEQRVEDPATRDAALLAAAERPFDLEKGPLFRVHVVHSATTTHLLFCAHHIIVDFWSIAVIVDELGRHHAGQTDEDASPPSYRAHVDAQAQYLASTRAKEDQDSWRTALAGIEPLNLPADRTRLERRTFVGGTRPITLPRPLADELAAVAKSLAVTPFAVTLAAFATLLGQLTGQQDIVVGVPTSGRGRSAHTKTVGYFVNTVPVRVRLDQAETFSALAKQTNEGVRTSLSLAQLPFVRLVESLFPGRRHAGRSPVFDVSCSWQQSQVKGASPLAALALEGSTTELEWGSTAIRGAALSRRTALFDLSLTFADAREGLIGSLEYSEELFDAGTVEAWAESFTALLTAAIQNPEQACSALSKSPGATQRALNDTEVKVDTPPVQVAFDRWATDNPNGVAVIDDRSYTYGEVQSYVQATAHTLQQQGVGRGDLVAIDLPRGVDAVSSILAVLTLGAGFVLLDQRQPRPRLLRMLEQAGPTAILGTSNAQLPPSRSGVSKRISPIESRPDELAYIMFTSGSTGEPKGVALEHKALTNRIGWGQREFPLWPGDTVLQNTTFGFDVCVWEIFAALGALAGARLAVTPDCVQVDPLALCSFMAEHDVSVAGFVPSLLAELVREPAFARCNSLRQVLSGGEALHGDLRASFFQVRPGAELLNFYGPAEAAIDTTYFRCSEQDTSTSVPIGRAIGNVQVYVLDPRQVPVRAGVRGEIYVTGDNLARGYIGDAALEDRFAPIRVNGDTARAYRTGDIGRWNCDGQLEFLGRTDDQLKIRGVRIEPAEIEAAMRRHPGVREAVVLAVSPSSSN